jgi:hypothetical protein
MNEYPAEIFIVFFDAVIKLLYVGFVQKAQYRFLSCPDPCRDDLSSAIFFETASLMMR